jgi:membrane protein DedA with SNARE-associated domain
VTGGDFGIGYLLGMFGVVAFGAVIPVVPTGAAVSVGAAVAEQDHVLLLVLVVAFGAAGAYVGDVLTSARRRIAGRRLGAATGPARGAAWLPRWLEPEQRAAVLARFANQIEKHELRTLLLSRLVPGGRIPVLLAAALGGYSWRRFAVADIVAASLWATLYAGIGVVGRAMFPEAWQAALAAVVLVLAVSAISGRVAARRRDQPDAGS